MRDLDPDLKRRHLPFYLRMRWLGAQVVLAIAAHFLWALFTIRRIPNYQFYLRLSVSVFVLASTCGYFYARLGSRFLGASLLRIRRGKERLLESKLGKMTLGGGIALLAAPQVLSAFIAGELLIPFYSGAVVGMGFSFFLWVVGLPR